MTRPETVREVSIEDVNRWLGASAVTVLDANPPSRFRRGHVPSAVNVDPAAVGDVLPEDKDGPLVFYCRDRSCGAAPAAARRATRLGYRNVAVMVDGIAGWLAAGRWRRADLVTS